MTIRVSVKETARVVSRVIEVTTGEVKFLTPTYFPSVSGTCALFRPEELIELVARFSYPRILISSYDLDEMTESICTESLSHLASMRKKGACVYLDSGGFEAYWKQGSHWSYDTYKVIKQKVKADIFTTFDTLPQPSQNGQDFLAQTRELVDKSMSLAESTAICAPIIHGKTPKHLGSMVRETMKTIKKRPKMLAVAERDCGSSLSERTRTIMGIRKTIDESDTRILLHILGCGDPLAMALYTYCGADTFDSLDWTEHAIQRGDFRIRNLFHYELMRCDCVACSRKFVSPVTKPLLHNLLFYQDFVSNLREMIRRDTLADFLIAHIGKDIIKAATGKYR